MGQLPEGYCPANLQELADAIAERMIVTSPTDNSSFATGSVEPASNVGPWLKNCESWYFYDDDTGGYIPQEKGGYNQMQYLLTSGNFTVPNEIYRIRVHAWGGGGGGWGNGATDTGGGGGGGGYAVADFDVTPGQVIAYTIGNGGAAGATPAAGGNTTFSTLTANGGGEGAQNVSGAGGSSSGGTMSISGGVGGYVITAEPGMGGDSPQGGQGGRPDNSTASKRIGIVPGGGGSGGYSTLSAGAGGAGAILIEY